MPFDSGNISESLLKYVMDGTCESTVERYASLKDAAAQADYGAFDHDLVVVDTETTGFSFVHDELIQIAAARMDGGKIVDWYVTFVDPGKPIPEEIVHLTGITEEDVEGAPLPNEALQGLAEFVGTSYVVAHNVGFDYTFCTKHPGGYPLKDVTWIDSLDLSRIAVPRMKSHRLLDLVRAFDAPISTHRADADVEATCAVLRILLAAIDAMPAPLVKEIASLATEEEWPSSVVFRYFDARNDQKNQQKGEDQEENARQEHFSLVKLRRNAVGKPQRSARIDADALLEEEGSGLDVPAQEEIVAAFQSDGLVGSLYSDYEQRQEQVCMACAVRDAFERGENLVVEAGTGVGKSMAYLVPSVLMARRNNIAVGVATKTNALLDQLVYHELPMLKSNMPDLTFAPLKGFSHYPCLRKVQNLLLEGAKMKEVGGKLVSQAPAIAGLLSYVEQTVYDDIDGLKIDYRSVPRWSFTTTSNDCMRRKCPFFGTACFVHGARRKAEEADVVVTNHSLLFCDQVVDGGLLPTARHWIIDEAHNAEAEARSAFSLSVSAEELLRLAHRLGSMETSRNPFIRAERTASSQLQGENSTLLFALTSKGKSAGEEFAEHAREFAQHMKDMLFFDQSKAGRGYEYVDLWMNDQIRDSATFAAMASYGNGMLESADKLILAAQNLVAFLEEVPNAADVQRDVASVAMRVKEVVKASSVVLGPSSDEYAYASHLSRKKERVAERLDALMVSVAPALQDTLYARTQSVVFASATVTVGSSFNTFMDALGLGSGSQRMTRTLELGSSFDFDHNMTVYVPTDIPEPNDISYLPALETFLTRVHLALGGSVLTLFTNRREMERCFDTVQPKLKEVDLRLVCQKWGVSTKGLRDEFLENEHLSLFALKSFWEGFDAPGATLKAVVIPKLPFARPSDPLSCERAARDDAAWRKYVLPAAIIETKQAAGRLIRKADDTGALILADKRLVTKSYGRTVLASMPSRNVKLLTCSEIIEELGSLRRG